MFHWAALVKGGPEREDHATVTVGKKVYCFGGRRYGEKYISDNAQIEVYVFNTVSLRWVTLTPVTSEKLSLEVPSRRFYHTAVLIDHIYIWGGSAGKHMHCNTLYGFDVDNLRWFKPMVSGTVPGARIHHSACVLGKVMYIFSGYCSMLSKWTNDIYKLDTTTMVWSLIDTRGTPPECKRRALDPHSATINGTKMFVCWGRKHQYINTRMFDTETNCWLSTDSAHHRPKGREYHSAFAYNGELYIYGGLHQDKNDLLKFSPETFSWREVKPNGKGPGFPDWQMAIRCCGMVGDRVIFFGGWKLCNIPLTLERIYSEVNDLYILDLSPSLKTFCKEAIIQYSLEQSGLPHNIRWELTTMTTNRKRKCEHTEENKETTPPPPKKPVSATVSL